jgi:hypothetical protein
VSNGAAHQRIEISFTSPLQICEIDPPPTIFAVLKVTYQRFTIIMKGDYFMYTLPVNQAVKMQVTYVDAENNPATVDGPVAWASSDTSLATLTVDSADSSIVTVIPVGGVGQVQITATADADLGQGVRQLITVCEIQLAAGEAVAGTIQPVGDTFPKP